MCMAREAYMSLLCIVLGVVQILGMRCPVCTLAECMHYTFDMLSYTKSQALSAFSALYAERGRIICVYRNQGHFNQFDQLPLALLEDN